ncbi:MAG: tRNA-binding EMAP/Myf-like protein [Psychromonas sp.]|jgi:tRNA-binding EMAP/Myf-like protein
MKFALSEGMVLATGPGDKDIYIVIPSCFNREYQIQNLKLLNYLGAFLWLIFYKKTSPHSAQ